MCTLTSTRHSRSQPPVPRFAFQVAILNSFIHPPIQAAHLNLSDVPLFRNERLNELPLLFSPFIHYRCEFHLFMFDTFSSTSSHGQARAGRNALWICNVVNEWASKSLSEQTSEHVKNTRTCEHAEVYTTAKVKSNRASEPTPEECM